jgi:hypothetical protein
MTMINKNKIKNMKHIRKFNESKSSDIESCYYLY